MVETLTQPMVDDTWLTLVPHQEMANDTWLTQTQPMRDELYIDGANPTNERRVVHG